MCMDELNQCMNYIRECQRRINESDWICKFNIS